MDKRELISSLERGLRSQNPVFKMLLGMCPTLAVTSTVYYALGMGLVTTAVLICSNGVVSLLRPFLRKELRIPTFIVIVATFVTVADLLMNAFLNDLHRELGIFIPLIVVNCLILGRAESFASKNPLLPSLVDGLSMGLGFSLALSILAACRELLGLGTILGFSIIGEEMPKISLATMAPGAFICLGLLLAIAGLLEERDG